MSTRGAPPAPVPNSLGQPTRYGLILTTGARVPAAGDRGRRTPPGRPTASRINGGFAVVFSTSTSAPPTPSGAAHMVVCGDDALAHRLAAELHFVYRTRVTVVIPGGAPLADPAGQRVAGWRSGGRASALFGRFSAAVGRVPLPRQTADDPAPDGECGSWRSRRSTKRC